MTSTSTVSRFRHPLVWIVFAFILLALIYAWATPPLEASDELWHVGMVNVLANTGELPVQRVGIDTPWEQEGSQPPLYYALAAALVSGIDRADFDAIRQPNPHVFAGVPGNVGNKNLVLHDSPSPRLGGTNLAVYTIRLFSIACGVVTVIAVYAIARLLVPDRRTVAYLAAALTAFNPMFLFITASVNNDNLVIALSSVILVLTLITLRDGFHVRRSIVIAVLVALASLTKLSGLVLVPVIALAALWAAYRRRDVRGLLTLGSLLLIVWLLLAGWWYARNLTLYGELFGTHTMAAVAGEREGVFTLATLISEFQGFRFTFWGVFGAVNIMTFRPFYDVMDAITVLALVGLAVYVIRTRDTETRARIALLCLLIGIGSVSLISWTRQTYASQGRLLFPYMAAIAPLLALGLDEIIARIFGGDAVLRVHKNQTAFLPSLPLWAVRPFSARAWDKGTRVMVIACIFALFALIVPFASIAPAYTPPTPLSALPADANPVYARYGDIVLIGYRTPDRRYQLGDSVPITVYWQVIAPSTRDLSLYLHAVAGETIIGRVDSYPGGGLLRTSTWQAGAIYADTYAIPLNEAQQVDPSRLRVQVGWWHFPSGEGIDPVDENGVPLTSVQLSAGGVADARVTESLASAEARTADFGGLIRLTGYLVEGTSVQLQWDALGTPADDLTVFVQAIDREGVIIGSGDAPPGLPTRYWRAGERFVTQHTLTFTETPTSGYDVIIGWYRPSDFVRLQTNEPDHGYRLTTQP